MKDTFSFPKTLRNYEQDSLKKNTLITPPHHVKSKKSLSNCYNPKLVVEQQQHNVGQYYILTNPSQFRQKQKKPKKTKNKNKSKQSHLSQALRNQLNRPFINHSQIGPQNIVHCRSLQKLQIISNDRSQQIKTLMNQKGLLISQNQDLKAKLMNPTYRQQEYIQIIAQKDFEVENLKQNLRRKQEFISQLQNDYKMQIQKLKNYHRQEIANLREQINKLRKQKVSESQKKYSLQSTQNGQNLKTQTIQRSYSPIGQPNPSNMISSVAYRVSQQSPSPTVVHSTNYKRNSVEQSSQNKSPLKITPSNNDLRQAYRTYVGEDGYERRVYLKDDQKQEGTKISTKIGERTTLHGDSIQRGGYTGPSSNTIFTNKKITSQVAKQIPSSTNVYKYMGSNNQNNTRQHGTGFHNQNLYSKSLTFQCFNDFS